jgi:ATP-dependent Zn protease
MVSLSINRTKSLLLLVLVSLQSFILAETATLSAHDTSIQQTEVPVEKTAPTQIDALPEQQAASAQETATDNAQLDTLLSTVLHQIGSIDSLIQDIALVTSNNQSLSKEQRSTIAKEIRALRDELSSLRNQSFTQADAQSIYLLLGINKELCDHLEHALAQGFKTLEPFPLTQIISKIAVRKLLNSDQLTQAIAANEISVAKLGRAAENIGLTWYNKLYRGVDSYVFQPWQKYNMTHYSLITLGATATAIGAWWYFSKRGEPLFKEIISEVEQETFLSKFKITDPKKITSSFFEKVETGSKLEQWLRKIMGQHPQYNRLEVGDGSTFVRISNEEKLNLPGQIEKNWLALLGGYAGFKTYAWPYIEDDYKISKNVLTKRVVEIHNNLKGGVFKNRTIKTSFEDYFKIANGSFDDMIGSENAKDILSGVADYLVNPEKFELSKNTPEKGYLLTGPTRTGKSFTAECFAGEVRKRLIAAGKSPDAVRYLPADVGVISALGGIKPYLELAKKNAPCIIFIDEIDLLGLQRAGGNSTLLADFLVALSEFSQQDVDKQVVVLAATNRSENLDDALKRRGRLGIEIRFSYPSFDYRKNFFVHKLESIGISTDSFDLDSITRQTVGRSYNDLESVLKKALQQAKMQNCQLDQELLERAIDSELFLILPENDHPLSEQERMIVATTIAGKILTEYLLNTGAPVVRATINPYLPLLKETSPWEAFYKEETSKQELIKYGKVYTSSIYEYLNQTYTTVQLKNTCKSLLAGRCAQQLFLGMTTHDNDTRLNMQKSFAIAKELVNKGLDSKMLSDTMRDSFADKAYALLETLEQETTTLLTEHKEQLERLIAVFLKLGTLNREEIAIIIEGKLPESLEAALKTGVPEVIKQPAVA